MAAADAKQQPKGVHVVHVVVRNITAEDSERALMPETTNPMVTFPPLDGARLASRHGRGPRLETENDAAKPLV